MIQKITLLLSLILSWPVLAQSYRDRLPQDEIIYFLLPDRFDNADSKNDKGGLRGDRLQTGFDPAHKGFFHGGDLKGVIRRLDYIQGLGATAIWLAPIFKNQAVRGLPGTQTAGYHGYWVTDFTTVDPHYGTDADFKALVDAAHARGMKVYMDIITNHTADIIQFKECVICPYRSKADYPDQAYTPYIPKGLEKVKVPAWLNDISLYHNRGNSTFEGESSTYGDFVELDDVKTEDPRAIAGFIDIYAAWIEKYGIDGFRVDTAKHVNPEFWQGFVPAILARAKVKGITNFHIFGEIGGIGLEPGKLAVHTHVAGFPAVLDFAFRQAVANTLAGNSGTHQLDELFAGDPLYKGGSNAAIQLPTFISNHDNGRFAWYVRQALPKASNDEVLRRVRLAHAMLLTLRGVPTIYAGDEQGFVGDGGDQDAREDMFASKTAVYNDNILLGTNSTTAQANFNAAHPLYKFFADLAALRQANPALRRGTQLVRNYSDKPGLFAVSRIDPATQQEMLLIFNTANAPLAANVEIDGAIQGFTSTYGNCPAAPRLKGSMSVTLQSLDFMICAGNKTK
jgi:neopullulanase